METQGFYKMDNNAVLYSENNIGSADFQLIIEEKDSYIYPIYGWYWFDTKENAYAFFNIEIPIEPDIEFMPGMPPIPPFFNS